MLPSLLFAALLFLASTPATDLRPTSHARSYTTLVAANATLLSPNATFALGFFTLDGGSAWYLGVWYASIPVRTYVWVANRAAPARSPATAALTPDGRLAVLELDSVLWATDNAARAARAVLLDTGDLVLLSLEGVTVWRSFDHPADTWLPEMAVTRHQTIVSWRSPSDPSPGPYFLRLRPPGYGEFELVFNGSVRYWSTGNWTGTRFAGVPEMTVPYIYTFRFGSPFTPNASFAYSDVAPPDSGLRPLLTRFAVDPSGQLMQYTWSPQAASWEMFWSRPESPCRVYGRCGSLGLCVDSLLHPCDCPIELRPSNPTAWSSGDFAGGCVRGDNDDPCSEKDGFEAVGAVDLDDVVTVSFYGLSQPSCEDYCRRNCSCFGLYYNARAQVCQNLFGNAYNLRNSSASHILYVRVSVASCKKLSRRWRAVAVAASISGFLLALGSVGLVLLVLRRRRTRERRGEREFPATSLLVFNYKELVAATKGFSDKLGHGGFGAVFRGALPDAAGTAVAVKRLERPGGGGDREFRAEVRTIGSVHHVNLVRLRGFCCEGAHRLLVYDFMPNGPLSSYLRRSKTRPLAAAAAAAESLSWEARYRIAVGTARGIAYLHEECRERIIHCDIKPENILLDRDWTPRVSDFGLARLIGRELSRVLISMRGTWGYVAPEWISGVAITPKADVYSYGMTLLELLSGRRNVDPVAAGEEEGWFFPAWAARRIVEGGVGEVVDPGLEGRYEVREAERAGRVAVWCIQDEEAARPAMRDVIKMLEGAVDVPVPPLPQLLQALVAGDSFPRAGLVSRSRSAGASSEGSGPGREAIREEA